MTEDKYSAAVHSTTKGSTSNPSNTIVTEPSTVAFPLESNSKLSLWRLPGLDKDTFYAAALYLHATVGDVEAEKQPKGCFTPETMRNFLDRLADCFARSKKPDARDHVSATAMVRSIEQKKIKLYIAKNKSYNDHETLENIENENIEFAKALVDWFNKLATEDAIHDELQDHRSIFQKMCNFSKSRLEYYIDRISSFNTENLERTIITDLERDEKLREGWYKAKEIAEECTRYQDSNIKQNIPPAQSTIPIPAEVEPYTSKVEANPIDVIVELAGKLRRNDGFLELMDLAATSVPKSKHENVAKLFQGISYLGRLYAAYITFWEFCRGNEQQNYSFSSELLRSAEDGWTGHRYVEKIESWTGDLRLNEERTVKKFVDGRFQPQQETVKEKMDEIVEKGKSARVHCEMQLMMHFLQNKTEDLLDYFGCSKKSCWLCWQLLSQNGKFSMKNTQFSVKDTHRKLYPLWAFPYNFSPLQPAVAEGLRVAYDNMLHRIQHMVIEQTALTSVEPYLQSSDRQSTSFRRTQAGGIVGPRLILGNQTMSIEHEAFPVIEVPALQFPHDSSQDVRQGMIWAYRVDDSRIWQTRLSYEWYCNQKVLLAFQLMSRPDFLHSTSEVDDFQQLFWWVSRIPRKPNRHTQGNSRESEQADRTTLDFWYNIYFRSAMNTLRPNPFIESVWEEIHPKVPYTFPWRGDVFVTSTQNDPYQAAATRRFSETEIDKEAFRNDLRSYFRACRADLATRNWEASQEWATRDLEEWKSTLENASRYPDPSRIGEKSLY